MDCASSETGLFLGPARDGFPPRNADSSMSKPFDRYTPPELVSLCAPKFEDCSRRIAILPECLAGRGQSSLL
jgi:hypothetical protein